MNIQEAFKAGLISERLSKASTVEYHRVKPTAWELKFGEGCVHYMTVDIVDAWHSSGRLKRYVTIGGLRYYRG